MNNIRGKRDIFGDLITQKRGHLALPILVLCAQKTRAITFEELGDAIGFPNDWRMGSILGGINTTHYDLERRDDWEYGDIPCITTIVVTKEGQPSDWMRRQLGPDADTLISWEDYKHHHIDPVFEYPHWDKMIDHVIRNL